MPVVSPDGIGSYGSSAELPPVITWEQSPSPLAPVAASPAQGVPHPDQFASLVPSREEGGPVLSDDLPPGLLVGAPPAGVAGGRGRSRSLGMTETDAVADRALLGAAFVLVGVGAAVGAVRGGLFGSIAGGLYGGAAVNAVRAAKSAKSDPKEALLSGTFAMIGGGIATWLLWKDSHTSPSRKPA